jgi:ureidoglycolate hydrolase
MQKPIMNIVAENFEKYGKVLEFTKEFEGNFEIIVREPSQPWRLAVYRVSSRTSVSLENHPDSMESFEPVRGTSLLVVAENHCPDDYEVYLLDKPICLHKGIWHDVVALSDDVLIRVTENHDVTCEFHHFRHPLQPLVLQECTE